ncbi:MAG: hypothetical protein KatS3mg065_0582 [Chloroflexota bacterium]|nr:MAG: hypothetical protein KatS3mg065_0582 [Chloroflexota bacterium]
MRACWRRAGGILAVVQSLLLAASVLLPASAIAAVSTDKWDYSIGEMVLISGDEMAPGESVRVEVFFPDGSLAQGHVVTAAEDGTFSDTFFLAEGMPGGIYRVVATGLSSGAVFTTEFDPATSSCMNGEVPAISGATATSLTVGWLDDCSNEDGFRIHYGLSSASLTSTVSIAPTAGDNNSRSHTLTGLTCGTTYYIRVEAFKNAPGPQSSSSSVVSGATSPCPPSDTTPPVVTPTISGTLGANGWYVSTVTVSWSVSDPESTVTSTSGCDPTTISSDTTGTTLTCTATSAGGTSSVSVTIKRDATAPTITYSGQNPAPNANGWNNSPVTLSWSCTDATAGPVSATVSETISTEGANQSATGTCTDSAGNTASDTQSGINIDLTPPSVSAAAAPAPNANGWNNTDVVVTFSGTDALSGIDACDPPVTISTEGAGQSTSGSCTDKAGNSASATASGISIDKTPPTVTATLSRPPDHNGWYNHAVTVTFTADDSLSDAVTCDGPVVYSGPDGASVSVSGSCTDAAGNSASGSVTFNYDATAPTISAALDRSPDGTTGWYNLATGAPTVTYTCTDATSGIASCTDPYTFGEGEDQSHTGTAVDNAGNSATASVSDVDVDLTAPTISAALDRSPDGTTGWYNLATGAPTVTYTCTDATSGIASCTDPYTFGEGEDQSHTGTAVDNAGNSATASVSDVDVDLTAPTITYSGQNPAPNANGWNNSPVTLSWSCTDATAGPVSATVSETISTEGANQSATGTCTDSAGNTASDTQSGINIDLTPPTDLTWIGGPADGGSYYFGFVPAEPTCTATDALSGLAGCAVTGYGTTVGSHTLTATATDKADNVATATRTYTVLAWETYGFYRPVDPVPVVNTVKAGSTVPLKFEVFAGALELTDTAIVDTLTYRQVACNAFEDMTESPVELTATGGTVLRYDWTAGQFIFNWKTPATPSKCYKTTLLLDDGSTISAYFKLK